MHALTVDDQGNVALIDFMDIHTHGWLRSVKGAKVYETGEILKDAPELHRFYGPVLSKARPLFAYLKGSRREYGDHAIRFRIGFLANNGFCVPSPEVVDANYELAEDQNV